MNKLGCIFLLQPDLAKAFAPLQHIVEPFPGRLRVHERISSQCLGVEAPTWQGAKVQEYLDIPSFRNAARRDASADKM